MIAQIKDGKVIATYKTPMDAIRATGVKSVHCCLSGRYSQAGGYVWRRI